MCVVISNSSGFSLYIESSNSGLFNTGHFSTDVDNELHAILIFLTDVPKPTDKRLKQNL